MKQDRLGTIGYGFKVNMKKPDARAKKRKNEAVTYETARQIALALPGVEESTSYGTPACKVGGKLFARLHQDGESLVVKVEFAEREILIEADPETFYITDHYLNYPWILVRLANVRRDQLGELLKQAWLLAAPKRLAANFYGLIE
ncbi:MAG TPA: MmcQ/YjbR family DNA-binding protein [Pyrinomonadaceae bacterium]|nr:MmcQ/YjbR family DNA-binding protein [Pyrinomonadaceae bacterium]